MNIQREQKQKFLVSEIIDKGYDPQDFQEYFFDTKGSQVNLDDWDLQNIKKLVYQYQQSKKQKIEKINPLFSPKQKQQQKQSQIVSQQLKQNNEENTNKQKILKTLSEISPKKESLDLLNQSRIQSYMQVVDCIKIIPSQLLNKNIQVKITKFDKKQGGIFQQSYYVYVVQTPILGTKVQRRYNDFKWLRQTLQFNHPGIPIPPIAKKGQYRSFNEKHLTKRKMILQMFLNELIQIPEIKIDQIFCDFLKFSDIVQFQKFKSDHLRTNNIQYNRVKNIQGKLNIAIDQKTNMFLINAQKHIIDIQPLTKNIFKDFKGVATKLEQSALIFEGVAKRCQQLNQKDEKFRRQNELKYQSSNMYTLLMNTTKKHSQLLIQQAKIFRTQIYSVIKYQNMMLLNTIQAFDKLKSLQVEYKETKNMLQKKKQKCFQEGNMSKWGLATLPTTKMQKSQAFKSMFPKQTQDFYKLRTNYGLQNSQMYQQLNRYFIRVNQYVSKYLMRYIKKQSQITSQFMMVWADALTQAMSIEQGKSIKEVICISSK